MRVILHGLLNPLMIFWIMVIAFALAYWLKREKFSRLLLCVALGWMFLVSVSPLPGWLMQVLESNYPVLDLEKLNGNQGVHIMVLGAGHSNAASLQPQNKLHNTSLARLAEAVRVYRSVPGSKIICSGASQSGATQAEVTALAAISLGVSPEDTIQLRNTRSTADEAYYYAQRFKTNEPLVVVTTAFHMPRAIECFRSNGLDPVAAPTGHFLKSDRPEDALSFKPTATKLQMTGNLLHEYAAWVVMKLNL